MQTFSFLQAVYLGLTLIRSSLSRLAAGRAPRARLTPESVVIGGLWWLDLYLGVFLAKNGHFV